MYSMVMMMAVASSGDVSSFGNKGGCSGATRAPLFSKHSNGCSGGGLLANLKEKFSHKKGSCHGAAPAPACDSCAAPAPACDSCAAPAPAPCGGGCDTPCGSTGGPIVTDGGCSLPGAPIVMPAATAPPKTMPAPVEPKKEEKKEEKKKES